LGWQAVAELSTAWRFIRITFVVALSRLSPRAASYSYFKKDPEA
jgi:hypothetical protein